MSLISATVSIIAIMEYYVPFATLVMGLSDLYTGARQYAVYEMFSNGTGKALSIFATVLLLINSVVQFFKPKAWLNFACAIFTALPILIVSNGDLARDINKEIGYTAAWLFSLILFAAWAIQYFYYIQNLRNVKRMAIAGGVLLALGLILPLLLSFLTIPALVVMIPCALCLLLTALLGAIFSSKRNATETVDETTTDKSADNDGGDEPLTITKKIKKNKIWVICGGAATILIITAIYVKPLLFPPHYDTWYVCNYTKLYKTTEGQEVMTDLGYGQPVALIRVHEDSIWATVQYSDRKDGLSYVGFVRLEDLTSEDPYAPTEYKIDTSEVETDKQEEYPELKEHQDEVEDDWDATTSIDWEGTINGKWKIEMTVHRLDGMVWGSYCYTKNRTSITLNGEWGDDYQLTLTESVDGNTTGKFIGRYGEDSFEGTWYSADGKKEYPFELKPIYKVEP